MGRNVRPWLDVSVIGRATSGTPYSPLVGGDINGDGARNDLAFVFDPATAADPVVAGSLARLLGEAPGGARECIRRQLGRIADRNSCVGPWSYSLDARLSLRPELPTVGRRLTLSVDLVNTLAGVDRLLHGEDDLRGWGQAIRPDAVLLYPRGFDPATSSYRYEVNERFGSARSQAAAIRNPFLVQLQGQLTVGRGRGQGGGFGGGMGGGRGGFRGPGGGQGGGAAGGGMDPAALVQRGFPNPVAQIVALRDSLGLSEEQVERLTALASALQQQQDSLSAELRRELGAGGQNRGMGGAMGLAQPRLERSRDNVRAALAQAREILSPDQWTRLPMELRTPPRAPGAGQRRRPPGQ